MGFVNKTNHRFDGKGDPKRPYYTRPGRNPKTRDNYKMGATFCSKCERLISTHICPYCKTEKERIHA